MEILDIAVFCASSPHGPKRNAYLDMANRLGRRLAEESYRCVNGGGDGMMGALSKGARDAGGDVLCVGLTDHPPKHTSYTEMEYHDLLTDRQFALINNRHGFIALPGGIGTLYEICEIAAKMMLGEIARDRPLLCVGSEWLFLKRHFDLVIRRGLVFDDAIGSLQFVPDVEVAIVKLNEALRP